MERTVFEPEHDAYRVSVCAWIQKQVVPHYGQWEKDGILPRSFFTQAAELGAFAAVPEEYGGAGIQDFRILEDKARIQASALVPGLTSWRHRRPSAMGWHAFRRHRRSSRTQRPNGTGTLQEVSLT